MLELPLRSTSQRWKFLDYRMKGLLSGTNGFPGILLKRKRQRGSLLVTRKKSRKTLEKLLPKEKEAIPLDGHVHDDDNGVEADAEKLGQCSEIPISYDGDKATVTLRHRQLVAMDGWAMVRLVEGRAAVHGYALAPNVEVLLCSNSKLAAVVTIESQSSSSFDPSSSLLAEGQRIHLISSESGESSDLVEKSAHEEYMLGCTLEFQSYRGGNPEPGSRVETPDDEPSGKRTFRIEIVGEIGTTLQHVIRKRKRDEEVGGGSPQGSLAGNEEEGSRIVGGDEDDGDEDEEDEYEKAVDQVDMDVDDFSDAENILLNGRDRKKPRKELRTPLNLTVIPDTWWAAANSIIQRTEVNGSAKDSEVNEEVVSTGPKYRTPIIAVCGPRHAGKSTFARFLLNFLLNSHEEVGYLDTDVGQPEFTVPGCLSLHIVREPIFGSPVLHLRNPERSFFYGDHSPKGDPEMYSRSVGALFDYFQRKYGTQDNDCVKGGIPLVINTHGWIKGIGYDVLVDILRHTAPTHVVEFTCRAENKNLPAGKFWESAGDVNQTEVLYIESALEGSNRPLIRVKTASDHLRDSRIMAYFRQCFSMDPLPYPYREDKLFAQTALSLVSHSPYQIPVSAVKIWHLHCQVPKLESLCSVNGAVVGLGVGSMAIDKDSLSRRDLPLRCVGLGIVRGIDAEKGLLYIITPVAAELLQDVDTLLQGRITIPVPLLQAKGYISPYLSHNSVAIEGTGSVAMQPHKKFVKC